jgi:uncharacterized protein DUF3558
MRPAVLAWTVATAVLLVGCSATTTGTPAPTTNTGAPTSSGRVPKVAKPLNANSLSAAPCSSLTAPQLAGLGLPTVHSGDNASITGAAICSWTDDTTINSISISWETGLGNGLSTVYSEQAQQGYWQPTTVDGYPAVFADLADLRPKGTCAINVGVSDQLSFVSKYLSSPTTGSKSCQFAEQAAADVIKNLGGA